MALQLARWSPRRMRRFWGAGLILEAVLLIVPSAVLVRPELPLVARIRGNSGRPASAVMIWAETGHVGSAARRSTMGPPVWPEDSFYTVLHWPLDKPLTAGGGRVVAIPMRFWWVPVLYVCAVPLFLVGLTGAWFRAKH
ncbi:MAG: hypothetical protein JWN53_62 [Gemmatimonadetes bacterium]|nr:hypothetical protein [Gemmatimonadota bacterium]